MATARFAGQPLRGTAPEGFISMIEQSRWWISG
jgi:hypothetical protein